MYTWYSFWYHHRLFLCVYIFVGQPVPRHRPPRVATEGMPGTSQWRGCWKMKISPKIWVNSAGNVGNWVGFLYVFLSPLLGWWVSSIFYKMIGNILPNSTWFLSFSVMLCGTVCSGEPWEDCSLWRVPKLHPEFFNHNHDCWQDWLNSSNQEQNSILAKFSRYTRFQPPPKLKSWALVQ